MYSWRYPLCLKAGGVKFNRFISGSSSISMCVGRSAANTRIT